MAKIKQWLKTRRARGGLSFFGYGVSIASNFFLANHRFAAGALLVFAALFTVYLFWPELGMLRLAVPKTYLAESPAWLYLFGVASIGLVVFAFASTYIADQHKPDLVSLADFSQMYISGKHFHIADFADSRGIIESRTFEDCWIYGPAVITVSSGDAMSAGLTAFEFAEFTNSRKGDLLIRYDKPLVATGVIVIRGCKFRHCHFLDVAIMGPSAMIDNFSKPEYGNQIR